MASLESLNALLTNASKLLDAAAREITDLKLEPVADHVKRVGALLVGVFELQQEIVWSRAPELKPAYLDEPLRDAGEHRRLGDALLAAAEAENRGDVAGAIRILEAYAATDAPPYLQTQAVLELQRLRKM